MDLKRYQWVGLLAGVPLFSGAWLTAFYDTPWWGVLGILVAMGGVYVANHVERRSDLSMHAQRGLVAGLLAGLVARLLGYISTALAGISSNADFNGFGDTLRVALAGNWLATLLFVVVCGVVGAGVASLEPEAKSARRRK